MALTPPWSDLTSELVVCISNAHGVSLRDYTSLRGVCTAWRSALEPPSYPCLLSLADDKGRYSVSVFSLPMRRPFHLHTASSPIDGRRDHDRPWLVSRVRDHGRRTLFSELRARAPDVGSSKPSSTIDWRTPSEARARVVGSSNGRFAVAVDHTNTAFHYCWTTRIFLLDPRAGKEVETAAPIAPPNCESGGPCHEYVHKVVFPPGPDDGTVVALYDHKYVAYIDVAAGHDKWTTINVVASNTKSLADLAFGEDGRLYCLDPNGRVHVVRIPRGGRNESAVVEPLSILRHNYNYNYIYNYRNPAAAFAPPYDIGYTLTTTKHIFFCHGNLYQVWQNNSCTVTKGGFRMSAEEILVLRYDPGRWPCWDAVKDLGGCSVFIDKKSSPAVVRAAGVPGVRADCVYWINWMRVPMVCDVATGTSKPCIGAGKGNCWYFGDDDITGIDGDTSERN